MSIRRFAGYFLALVACAIAGFSAQPDPAAATPPPPDFAQPVQVAFAH